MSEFFYWSGVVVWAIGIIIFLIASIQIKWCKGCIDIKILRLMIGIVNDENRMKLFELGWRLRYWRVFGWNISVRIFDRWFL